MAPNETDTEAKATEFVTECWEDVSKKNDYVYVSQIPQVVQLIEQKLSCKSLLASVELKLLSDMMTEKPLLKLYKSEFKDFILKLANYPDLLKFLTERIGISPFNLNLLLSQTHKPANTIHNKQPSRPEFGQGIESILKSGSKENPPLPSFKPSHGNSPMKTSTPLKPTHQNESPILRPNGFKSNLNLRDKQINQRDDHISLITKENQDLFQSTKIQLQKIKELERQYEDLRYYVDILETKFDKSNKSTSGSSQSDRLMLKDLIKQCSERDDTIKKLEEVCLQYQQEFDKLKNNSVIQKLTDNLQRQDKLITDLKSKLQLQLLSIDTKDTPTSSEQLQQFIAKVPILKQYYMYYQYREQHKNLGIVFINVLSILVTGGVAIVMVRIFFLILLQVFHSSSSGQLDYIYDDYSLGWSYDQDKVSIVWWKEIEWLEYLAYSFNDWLEGV